MTRAVQETRAGGARTHARTSGADGDRCLAGDGNVVQAAGSDDEATVTGAAGLIHKCAHTVQSWAGSAGA